MRIVRASKEFHHLTEVDVLAALDDPHENNPIAHEISRLIDGYMDNLREYCEETGRIPDAIVGINPANAIERVAKDLTNRVLRDALRSRAH